MNNWKRLFEKAKIDAVDTAYAVLVGAVLMLLANLANILDAYNVPGSRQILQSAIGRNTTDFLARVDDFRITKTVVLFLFWGFVGLITYLLTQSIISARAKAHYDAEIGSGSYVHPESFSANNYWREIVKSRLLFLFFAILLIAVLALYFANALPFANSHLANLVNSFSWLGVIKTICGLLYLVVVGSLMLFCFRLLRNRTTLLS